MGYFGTDIPKRKASNLCKTLFFRLK